jgi:hypothetical protein
VDNSTMVIGAVRENWILRKYSIKTMYPIITKDG